MKNMLITVFSLFGVVAMAGDAFYDGPNVKVIEQGLTKQFTVTATGSTNTPGTNLVVMTATDLKGTTTTATSLARVWSSATAAGAAATNDVATFTSGVALQAVATYGDYVVIATNGVIGITLKNDVGVTNYINVVTGGGPIVSTRVIFQ